MNRFLLNIGIFVFGICIFTGCGFVNSIKGLKQDVVASLNYNENEKLNTIQIEKQLSFYRENFTYDVVTELNDYRFDPSFGKTGLWLPMKFIENIGGGVYFLDSFSSNKIPIVLVHGAGGHPREWETLINTLKDKFQIIVVSYASGMRLSQSSEVIYNALSYLMKKYHFQYMPIVAHSMGGLVMKDVISKMTLQEQKVVQKFITISTPWDGDKLANRASSLDYTLPYWVDMKPQSEFLNELNHKEISSIIKHYLFFGYKGKITLTAGISNDGVISLESQLKQERQENAYKVFGYNETHTSILHSQIVIENIHKILLENI